MDDTIDHGVGLKVLVRVGKEIEAGQPLVNVYSRNEFDQTVVQSAFEISEQSCSKLPLIHERIE